MLRWHGTATLFLTLVGIFVAQCFLNRGIQPSFAYLLYCLSFISLGILTIRRLPGAFRQRKSLWRRRRYQSLLALAVLILLPILVAFDLFRVRHGYAVWKNEKIIPTVETGKTIEELEAERAIERDREEEELKAPPVNLFEGGTGKGRGKFDHIMAIAEDRKGFIYVVDMNNHRIQKFDANGDFVLTFGKKGQIPGQFNEPRGIAVDEKDNVYVMDTWNSRIQKFNSDGEYITEFRSPTGFYGAKGITVSKGRIFVSDSGNGRIEVLDTSGKYIASWGKKGSGDLEFLEPVGIVADPQGFVYVIDSANDRIQKLGPDGNFVKSWKVEGWKDGGLKEIYIGIGPDGYLYLSDPVSESVLKYSKEGEYLEKITEKLSGPSGISVTGHKLLVGERYGGKVRKVELSK